MWYVAGEILVWMVLALLLGVLIGRLLVRSRRGANRQQVVALRKERDELAQRLTAAEGEHATLAGRYAAAETAAGERDALDGRMRAMQKEHDALAQRAAVVVELDRERTALRARLAELQTEHDHAVEVGKVLRTECDSLGAQVTQAQLAADEATRQREARVMALTAERDELGRELAAARAQCEAASATLDGYCELAPSPGALRLRLDGLEAQLDAERAEHRQLQSEHRRLQDDHRGLLQAHARLQSAAPLLTAVPLATDHDGGELTARVTEPTSARATPAVIDLTVAAQALGRTVIPDDLTVVEGIGPAIAGVLEASGIRTWDALASADETHLRRVLDEAGPRFRVHDPASWPQQAALAARAQWSQLRELQARLDSGRLAPAVEDAGAALTGD